MVGAEAARATGLRVGDRFYEGEEMAEFPLTVVGILGGPAARRPHDLLLAPELLGDERGRAQAPGEAADRGAPPGAAHVRLPALHRELNVSKETQAVFPSAVLLEIFNLLRLVEDTLAVMLVVIALVVFLYLFVSMYGATLARAREIATMRALGARRATIFAMVLVEGCVITLAGGVAGILAGHGVAFAGARLLARAWGLRRAAARRGMAAGRRSRGRRRPRRARRAAPGRARVSHRGRRQPCAAGVSAVASVVVLARVVTGGRGRRRGTCRA